MLTVTEIKIHPHREYMVGLAMQGIVQGLYSSSDAYKSALETSQAMGITINQMVAENAISIADEVIKQF